jgi:hypothetical protein
MRFRVEFENFSGQDAASARLQISPVHVEGVAIRDAIRSLKKNKTARPADLARKRPEFSAATAMRRYFRLLGACVRGNARFGRAAFSRVNAGYIGLQSASDCGTRSVVGGTDLLANSDYHPWIPTLSLLRARIAPAQPPPKGMWATTALDSVSPE